MNDDSKQQPCLGCASTAKRNYFVQDNGTEVCDDCLALLAKEGVTLDTSGWWAITGYVKGEK